MGYSYITTTGFTSFAHYNSQVNNLSFISSEDNVGIVNRGRKILLLGKEKDINLKIKELKALKSNVGKLIIEYISIEEIIITPLSDVMVKVVDVTLDPIYTRNNTNEVCFNIEITRQISEDKYILSYTLFRLSIGYKAFSLFNFLDGNDYTKEEFINNICDEIIKNISDNKTSVNLSSMSKISKDHINAIDYFGFNFVKEIKENKTYYVLKNDEVNVLLFLSPDKINDIRFVSFYKTIHPLFLKIKDLQINTDIRIRIPKNKISISVVRRGQGIEIKNKSRLSAKFTLIDINFDKGAFIVNQIYEFYTSFSFENHDSIISCLNEAILANS